MVAIANSTARGAIAEAAYFADARRKFFELAMSRAWPGGKAVARARA